MIEIVITAQQSGKKALVYEYTGRRGRRKFVPSYEAYARCQTTGQLFEFTVVRDSCTHVFGEVPEDRYGEGGECPPSIDPYHGTVREDGSVGFRIELSEPGCGQKGTLRGRGTSLRKNIQIHYGAACAHGCVMVTGRRRLYHSRFAKCLRSMLQTSDMIRVIVHER
jgi:hypothetical protein